MSRRLSGEISPAELAELEQLMASAPDKQYLMEVLQAYFNAAHSSPAEQNATDNLEERFSRIVSESVSESHISTMGQPPASDAGGYLLSSEEQAPGIIRLFRKYRLAGAAVIGGLVLLTWTLSHKGQDIQPQPAPKIAGGEISARPGTRTRLILPDGTQVWLNSNSKLKYDEGFNTQSRDVVLEGEAYFDVTKNAKIPFVVHSDGIMIRVLGTAFTIKSYPQDQTIETTLLKGMIEVSRQDNPTTPRVILKPNEKLVFNKHLAKTPNPRNTDTLSSLTPEIAVGTIPVNIPDSDKVETAWMYNKLVFNGDTFAELAAKMERWYNVRIVIRNESLAKHRFSGVFTDETVTEALDALQFTARFGYRTRDNEIELFEK